MLPAKRHLLLPNVSSLQFLNRHASSPYQSLTGSLTAHSRLTYWKGNIEGRNLLKADSKSASSCNSSALMGAGIGSH